VTADLRTALLRAYIAALRIAAALLSVVQQYGDQRAAEALDAAYWATAAITDPEAVREVILARAAALRGAGR
jgi:hypothetical protein